MKRKGEKMKKFSVIFLILLMNMLLLAQETHIINFENDGVGADWNWTVAENDDNPALEFVANPATDGINTSTTAAKFIARQAGQPWALFFTTDDGEFTFDATNSTVTLMVNKPVISDVAVKFEGLSAPIEIKVANTVTNEWEELTFDFSALIGNQYNKLIIIPDFNLDGRTQDNTIYLDNITVPDGVVLPPPPEPTIAAPTPTIEATEVLSIYSDAYTNLPGTNFNPSWGQSTVVTVDYLVDGNNTLKYEGLNFQGTEFTNQDVSAYDYLHVDFWTPNSTELNFFLISPGAETSYALTIEAETWVSVDIPLSAFLPTVDLADLIQFKVVGNGTVWFDNWYFWKDNSPGTDASLSDLKVDDETVAGFMPTILNYDVELPFGTTTVPLVTASPTDPMATVEITEATGLPGTTSVEVTAEDATTTATYSINFTVAEPDPEPIIAAPVPTEDAADVFSIYSDAYTDLENTNFNPGWGQNTVQSFEVIDSDNVIKLASFNYQGINLGSADGGVPQNVSAYTHLHVDFWTPNATVLNFFVLDQSGGEVSYPMPVSTEEWVSVDIPLSHFTTGGENLADIHQFKLDGGDGVSTVIWLDNLYFFTEEVTPDPEPTIAAPVPTEDAADVFSIYSDAYTDLENTNFNPGWGQNTVQSFEVIDSDNVIKLASFNYQGINLGSADGGVPQNVSAYTHLHVDFWTPNATVLNFFVLDQSGGEVSYPMPVSTEEWVSVDIPLSHFTTGGEDLADIHQFKLDGGDGASTVIWLDNLYFFTEEVTPDPEPTIAAPVPTHLEADVVSIFSDSYTNLPGTDFNPGWGQTTVVTTEDIDGNAMLKYANFNYQGTQLSGNQDLSLMTYLHIDMWTANATDVKVTPISASTGEFAVSLTPIEAETWNSYDIPLSDFQDLSMADIHQLKFDGQAGITPSDIYLDNIYFYKLPTPAGSDATLSDLKVDGETVAGFAPTVLTYNVELPFGTETVPSVTATATDTLASLVINDAAELPGSTTVVVTAEDDSTMLTYSVNFSLAPEIPTVAAPVPTEDAVDVISLFSEVYDDVPVDTWRTDWSSAIYEEVVIAGDTAKKYSNLDFVGIETVLNQIDATGMSHFHLDIWSANMTMFGVKLVDFGADAAYGGSDDTEHQVNFDSLAQAQWVSLDIPLSDFTGLASRQNLAQLILVGQPTGSATVYVDNVYFYSTELPPAADATLSDLQVDGETVTGFAPTVLSYNVELPFGTETVPTVTATATDTLASLVINDAAELPGSTTVVVTAEDDSTMLTYSVNFTLAAPTPTVAAPVPTEDAADVISLFSNAYTNVTVDTWSADWDQADMTDMQIESDDVKLYTNLVYAGIEFTSETIDATEMTHFRMDIWTPDSTVAPAAFKIKLVDFGADAAWGGGDDVEHELSFENLLVAEWNSLDIPLSDFTGLTTKEHLAQLIISGDPNTVYVDNVYFYTTMTDIASIVPTEYALSQNYPNPFNPETAIRYQLSEAQFVNLTVFNLLGQPVATLVNGQQPAGFYQLVFNPAASQLTTGVYFYRLQAGDYSQIRKMIFMK
jgi:hypothetical protein